MNTRVHLSRIIAYNWYGYRRIIELAGLSLITGANGSGKSALLDLLQFVLLGEQHSRFNKAAAGAGSGRTLRGYCLCDTNTVGKDGQERYLRPSGVTLAALEFCWPAKDGEEPRRETWGARIEYEGPTAKARTIWFTVPTRLEGEDFLGQDLVSDSLQFLTEDEFRVHVKRELGGEIFDRQTTYLEEMGSRSHLGFDRKQMNKTLPNSMAFQPVESFEKFIREYLLEQALPDVATVRSSVDAHRRAQDRLEKMRDQHERLTRIGERHHAWLEARRESALFRHLRDALSHEERREKLEKCRAELNALRQEHAEQRADHEAALKERNELDAQLREVRLVAGNDTQITALANQRARRDEVAGELTSLNEAAKTAREYLHDRVSHWKQWLKMAEGLELKTPENASDWLETMRGIDEAAGLDAAEKMPRIYHELHNAATEELRPIREKLGELESRELRLKRELEDLTHKGSSHASPLLDALKSRGQKAEALQALVAGEAVLLRNALTDLANYATDRSAYSPLPKHYRPHIPAAKVVWAKGPDFDCKILQHACEAVSIPYPFHFSNHRCVRTIIDVAFPDPDQRPEFTGVAHDARDDAINQALSVQMAYQALRLNHTPTTANPTTLPLVTT